jgi:DNA-binding NtrC family response regulator
MSSPHSVPQTTPSIRVLLVDDEQDLVEFLSQRLLRRGFTVTSTTSGADAVEAVKRQAFDVAIVDLKMPLMDGVEVLRRIKEMQPYLEAIMLTGHGSAESAHAAGRLDAFRYVMKPCDYEELVGLIQEAYKKKRKDLFAMFQRELQSVMDRGGSPREIMAATDRLRLEYEQN